MNAAVNLYDLSAERDMITLLVHEEKLASSVFLNKKVTRDFFRDLFNIDVFDYLQDYFLRHRFLPSRKEMIRNVPKFMTRHSQFKKPESQVAAWQARIKKIYNADVSKKIDRFAAYVESLDEHRKARAIRDSIINLKNLYDKAEYDKAIEHMMATGAGNVMQSGNGIVEGNIITDFTEHQHLLKQTRAGNNPAVKINMPIFFDTGNNSPMQANFDDLFDGGFYAGDLCVIIGEVNVGKSFFLMECGYGAARYNKKNVVLCTIEMGKIKQQRRIYSRITRINYNAFKTGALSKKEELLWKKKIKWWELNCGAFHVISFPEGCTVSELAVAIKEVERKYGIKFDLLVVDYMNDMRPSNNFSNRLDWDAQGEISWEMANLAKSWNNNAGIPIVTAIQRKHSQIHKGIVRSNEGAFSPLPSDHTTIGIGMSQTIEDEIAGRVCFNLWKNRDGEKGQVFYTYPRFKVSMISSIRAAREYYNNDMDED